MSRADLERWEARYAASSPAPAATPPDPFFAEVGARHLPAAGTAADLAGGSGRHACWLAARGLTTTLLDIAPAALSLARARAAQGGLALRTLRWDLDDGLPAERWDVVLLSYFLLEARFGELSGLLRPGGVLLMVHPTTQNLERHPRPGRRWVLEAGRFSGMAGLETLHLEEGWGARGRHEVRYIGRRPLSG